MIPGAEAKFRSWLGAGIATGYAGFPSSTPTYPMFVMSRVGGNFDGYIGQDQPVYSVQVYSTRKTEVEQVAAALVSRIESVVCNDLIDANLLVKYATVNSVVWSPDGDLARYVIDLEVGLAMEGQ